jgi:hypothetical protein
MQSVHPGPFALGPRQKMDRGPARMVGTRSGATLFSLVSTNWSALASSNSLNLENTNNLQANKWQTYAIAILATPTSGHLIRIVQNEIISTTSLKNGKFTIYGFLSALSITAVVAIGGHSSLTCPDHLLSVLQPFPSGGVGDGL